MDLCTTGRGLGELGRSIPDERREFMAQVKEGIMAHRVAAALADPSVGVCQPCQSTRHTPVRTRTIIHQMTADPSSSPARRPELNELNQPTRCEQWHTRSTHNPKEATCTGEVRPTRPGKKLKKKKTHENPMYK